MRFVQTIVTALLVVSFLPWCGLAAASATLVDVDDPSFLSGASPVVQAVYVTETRFDTARHGKGVTVLPQVHCGVNAPLPSDPDDIEFFASTLHLVAGCAVLVPRAAQAPPTSPPRAA
ncbi:hypothetical protein HKCCE4037_17430 [Rhodobacterales bacterium HKCCE4037]|nr:hypothetical protein [Rhodobacterales bacterium HKCCE4037]